MEKTISVVLVLVLILALSATAFADYGIVVTKNPTDETRTSGETAWFVSEAQYYTTLDWTFVDPAGREYTVKEFRNMFPYSSGKNPRRSCLGSCFLGGFRF